jgi:hypothetical protein
MTAFGGSFRIRARFDPADWQIAEVENEKWDGYDIEHLTRGLSRCDLVTADSSMTELCRAYKLVPAGCQLCSYRELDAFQQAVEEAVPVDEDDESTD